MQILLVDLSCLKWKRLPLLSQGFWGRYGGKFVDRFSVKCFKFLATFNDFLARISIMERFPKKSTLNIQDQGVFYIQTVSTMHTFTFQE
jgi:hypothetical protein